MASATDIATRKSRRKRIYHLGLPIIGGMISQNILNLIDTAMVGRLGDAALGGVGMGGFANFLVSSIAFGLSSGVQAITSRRLGEGKSDNVASALNAGLVIVVIFTVPWSAFLFQIADWIFPWLNSDPDVIANGVPYWRARLVAMAAIGMNFCFRGYWNAVDRSQLYMRTLFVMHFSNIFLNWVLIFGNLGAPELGTQGAGIASAISTWIGTGVYFFLGLRHAKHQGFLRSRPTRDAYLNVLRISIPQSMQQFFFSAGLTANMWIVGLVGIKQLASHQVILNLLLVGILPCLGFGLAAATLVGQSLGAGKQKEAEQWGWDVVRIANWVMVAIALPVFWFPDLILSGFISDPATIEVARLPLRIAVGTLLVEGTSLVLMNAMIGAGYTKKIMWVATAVQWLGYLPCAYLIGPHFGLGFAAIWWAYLAYRIVLVACFLSLWTTGHWKKVTI